MNKTVTSSLLVLSLVFFNSCKEDNASEKVKKENIITAKKRDVEISKGSAEIEFDITEFDFGTIDQGTAVEHVFKFTNTGEAPLVIVNAKSTCGCTVPSYPKTPIAPGDSAEMLVKFNGSGKNQVSKTVTITSNTLQGTETISIKAFVNPKAGSGSGPTATN